MAEQRIDRMVILIVYRWQAGGLIQSLAENRYQATVVDATGGLLREGLVTLVVGTAAQRLPALFSLVRDTCPATTRYIPYDADVEFPWHPDCEVVVIRAGGVSAFVLPVEQFVQL